MSNINVLSHLDFVAKLLPSSNQSTSRSFSSLPQLTLAETIIITSPFTEQSNKVVTRSIYSHTATSMKTPWKITFPPLQKVIFPPTMWKHHRIPKYPPTSQKFHSIAPPRKAFSQKGPTFFQESLSNSHSYKRFPISHHTPLSKHPCTQQPLIKCRWRQPVN